LRRLLFYVRGAASFADIRVDPENENIVYGTYREACLARKLLQDDSEWFECLKEHKDTLMPPALRTLMFQIFAECQPSSPFELFWKFAEDLSDDFLHTLQTSEDTRNIEVAVLKLRSKHQALLEIETKLLDAGESLDITFYTDEYKSYKQSVAHQNMIDKANRFVNDELKYDAASLTEQCATMCEMMNEGQKTLFDTVIDMVYSAIKKDFSTPSMIFGDAPGGTGKTFINEAICARLRGEKKIVIAVASSGIAAQLLPAGRTAHYKFQIPFKLHERSSCYMQNDKMDPRSILMRKTSLIIIDEATMLHRHAYQAIDTSLKDITGRSEVPFGGIPVLFTGDFRQILPIVKQGSRMQTMSASLERCDLWKFITVMHLTENMRVKKRCNGSQEHDAQLQQYSDFLLRVGDGVERRYPERGEEVIKLPDEIVSKSVNIAQLVDEIFTHVNSQFDDKNYLCERAILTPLNVDVDKVNKLILEKCPGSSSKSYLSADYVSEDDDEAEYSIEYLNSLNPSGLPPHELFLKVGAPIMLLRNIKGHTGACNGAKLIINKMLKFSLVTEFATGDFKGEQLIVPRIPLCPSDTDFPFSMTRRQFPVRLAFAMTINKSQGQTLSRVGVYLPQSVFSHGQLYVALSRVGAPSDLKVLLIDNGPGNETSDDGSFTSNVVYKWPLEAV